MNKSALSLLTVVSLSILFVLPSLAAKRVEMGDDVEVLYVGRLVDGRIFDANLYKGEPLKLTVGSGLVLKAFEDGLVGMKKKDTKTITIPAAEAYGEVDEDKIIKLKSEQIPEGSVPGRRLELRSFKETIPVRLVKLEDDIAYVDANHVLAGKGLIFDIEVVGIDKK